MANKSNHQFKPHLESLKHMECNAKDKQSKAFNWSGKEAYEGTDINVDLLPE
jgi:hypothetical protein